MNQNTPIYWRRVGWAILLSDLAVIAWAGFAADSNQAAVLVVLLGLPFLPVAGALAASWKFCEWIAMPQRKRDSERRHES